LRTPLAVLPSTGVRGRLNRVSVPVAVLGAA
jgi:hypothetical protein